MYKLKQKALLLGMATIAFSGAANATPQQGTLNATSTGVTNISITKSVQAQISDVSDMTLSNWSVGGGAVALYSNLCIYSSTGSYKVQAYGNGLLGAFTLSNGSLFPLPYSVTWNAGGQGNLQSTGTSLIPNILSSSFSLANSANATCSGGGSANDTARVVVGVSSTDMEALASSNIPYTGTLTMVVSPY